MSDLLTAAKDFLRAQGQVDMSRKDGGPDQQRAYRFRNQAIKALKKAVAAAEPVRIEVKP